jgi:hypothetical protein
MIKVDYLLLDSDIILSQHLLDLLLVLSLLTQL